MKCPKCGSMTRVVNSRVPGNKSRELSKVLAMATQLVGDECPLRVRERACPQCGYFTDTLEAPLTSIMRTMHKKKEE